MKEENPYAPRTRWTYASHRSGEVLGEVMAVTAEEAAAWFAYRKVLPIETFHQLYLVTSVPPQSAEPLPPLNKE